MPASLKSRIPELAASLRPAVGAAVKETATIVVEEAQDRVPVDEGDLYEAIHIERRAQASYAVVAGNEDVFYGMLVEFGSGGVGKKGPRPYLVPAAEASVFAGSALVTGALQGWALKP